MLKLLIGSLDFRARGQRVITIDSCYNEAHDLTFNVIGATMAYYNLTFNVIGATIESPSQNPLACLYKRRVCGNQAELLRRNLCHVSRSPRGCVGGQQAHLSSGPLGFAEGSSTASLFLQSAPCTAAAAKSL